MDPKRHWTALALVLGAGCTAHTTPPLDSSADALSGSDAIVTDTIATDTAATEGGLATPAARCAAITESIRAAGFSDKVTVRCDERYAYIVSDTYPDHVKMTGITGTNDQVPVPAPGYTTPISLAPSRAAQPTSIDAALGVAVNGVPIYDYSSQGTLDLFHYDPRTDTKLTGELDQCNGHSGRGDDYHYHASPTCMIAAMRNRGDAAIIGWGFDGYPIFGNNNPDGTSISAGQLDVCNGQSDPVYGYRYTRRTRLRTCCSA